jgi:exodeoxyribonuclease V alpha subunit
VGKNAVGRNAVVQRLSPLSGDGHEAWVAGLDPDTGQPKGRLRSDDRAVRFVEVIVNGPKSWSLAAERHPNISVAYDAAQDRAASEIIAWLAEHARTRVGPRGGQVQVPVEALEAVTVRHYTSRAGDLHRHLHLQINARVFAEGEWRGLHTIGVRDSLTAINGIGHATMVTDPHFRAALAVDGSSPMIRSAAGDCDRFGSVWRGLAAARDDVDGLALAGAAVSDRIRSVGRWVAS